MEDLAGHYAEAIRSTFGEPVSIMGTSTGGSIAQRLAVDHPGLVRRLVLVATACRLSPYTREVQRRLAELVLAGRPRRAWAAFGPAMAATAPGGWALAALLWLAGRRMTPDDPSDLIAEIEAEDAFDVCRELRRITAPTLVIAGERDRCYPPELTRMTAGRIPDARLRLYPRRAHFGTVAYVPAIREIPGFLTAHGGVS